MEQAARAGRKSNKSLLNNVAQDPGLTNATKVSSVINLARDMADADLNDNAPQQLWQVMFGDDSLYRLLGAELDFNNQPYRMYLVQDVDDVDGIDYTTYNLRIGGYIQRRHSSTLSSPDRYQIPNDSNSGLHDGFVEEVDGIQLELPQPYRFGMNANYLDDFRSDLAGAILQFVDANYGIDVLP